MLIRNLQNIPREKRIRRLFIPNNENEILIEADLSQAEGMVVAWYAQEKTLMKLYRDGKDVHSYVGSIILEKKITKENKDERQLAKRVVHASNYGTSPQKVTEVVLKELEQVISLQNARRTQNIYFQNFPRIRSYFQRGIEQELASNNRVLVTPTGFVRKFYTPKGHELYRAAYAHYPQNVVAYVTNSGVNYIRFQTRFGGNLYTQTHDSIAISVDQKDREEAIGMLKQALTLPISIKGEELVIPVDIKIGPNLGDLHEID